MDRTAWTPETQAEMTRLLRRSKRTSTVQFSPGFIRSRGGENDPKTPLSRLVGGQGGRGGAVRLKLFLCVTALATNVRRPTVNGITGPAWARVLGLNEPDTKGRRRITEALAFLDEDVHLLRRQQRRAGEAAELLLLHPDGSERPHPGRAVEDRSVTYWVTVPLAFFREGWVVMLSGPAVAVYLVLRELLGKRHEPVVIDAARRQQYGIARDTWRGGVNELEAAGLLTVEHKMTTNQDFYKRRNRDHYWLHDAQLERGPRTSAR